MLKSLLEDPTATIVGAAVDLLLLIPLVLTHRALMRDLLEPSPRWYLALYALLVVAGALVPLHYHLALPVGVYIGFISVSVVWQDVITFGLLQHYLRRSFSLGVTAAVLPILFLGAHLLFIPGFYRQPVNVLFVLVMAPLFALLRERTGRLQALRV